MKFLKKISLTAFIVLAFAISALAQNVNVNPGGGSYPTLADAFTAINAGTHTGAITVEVVGDTTETVSAVLNASGTGAASYTTITVTPTGARTIAGAIAGHLIDLNGADNVTINGLNAAGNSLTISNTSITTSSSTIRFIADATNNVVTNSSVLGATGAGGSSGFGVIYFATGTTTGNDGNTISNNNISASGGGNPINGIYSFGTSTAVDNGGITITGNNISDYFNLGGATSGINVNAGSSAWTITNNKLYQTAERRYTTANTHSGINILVGSGYTVTGNTLGYANSAGTGTTNMIGSSTALGGTFPSAYTTAGTANATRYIAINATFTAAGVVSNIQGNTIAGFALYTSSGATTTTGIFCGICVNSGNVNIGTTSGNTIGTSASSIYTATTTTGGVVSGIYVTSANTVNIQNNTIQNIDAMGTTASISGAIKGIETSGTAATSVTVSNNIVGNATNPNLRMGNLTTGATLSNIGTTFGTASGAGVFQGIVNANSSTAVVIGSVGSGNIVRNANLNSTSASSRMAGINSSAGNVSMVNNSVSNLTTVSASTSANSTASIVGISLSGGSTAGQTIARNTVQNLSNTAATAVVVVNALYWGNSSSSPATNIVERNLLQNCTIASTGVSATLQGIKTFNGGATYKNNMILLGTDSAGTSLTQGTLIINAISSDTLTSATNNWFNNSIQVRGTGVATGTANTTGFLRITSDTMVFQNNIIVNNRSNGTGTGKHYELNLNNLTTLSINYNLYNQTGTGAVFGTIAAVDSATFAAWQTATSQEANSSFADPLWTSLTDLHLTAASPARDTGLVIASVINDFDGKSRPGINALYDRGADEFDGIAPVANDIQATAFIDPTNGGFKAQGAAFSPQASFTNNGTSTQTGVMVRYRICTDGTCATEIYNNTATIATINSLATVNVTFPSTSIATPGTYTIKAKAELGTDTVPANDEITGTFDVLPPLSGNYTVGSGGNYSSLTNNGGIFQAINNLGATSNLTIDITSDLTGETGANSLLPIAGGYTVLIKPSGAARSITSTTTATGLITLFGADNVTIDGSLSGGSDRSLTLINQNSTTSGTTVVAIISQGAGAGATNNTIKNTVIQNGTKFEASTTSFNFGIYVGGNGVAGGYDNDETEISNNLIQRCYYGMQVIGDATGVLNDLVIADNTIGGAVTADYIGRYGMFVGQATGATVIRNTVRNHLFTGAADGFGIFLSTGFINSSVTRNEITNLEANNSGGYGMTGIGISSANATSNLTVANNFVSDIRGTSWTTAVLADTVVGIRVLGVNTGGVNIWYNSVNLFGDYAGANNITVSAAFMVNATTPTNLDVRNNIFVNSFNNTTVTTDKNYAIYTNSANTMFSSIDFNDYFVSGAQGVLSAINSTDAVTLTALQTATAQDANSLSVDPLFISGTNLHLQPTSPVRNVGTPVTVTTDFDGQSRPNLSDSLVVQVDMGGDEFYPVTSAPASIGGRVSTAEGNGIRNAAVTVSGGDLPAPVTVKTGSFGIFTFENLTVGQTYIISVESKRFVFNPPTRVITLDGNVTDLSFVSEAP